MGSRRPRLLRTPAASLTCGTQGARVARPHGAEERRGIGRVRAAASGRVRVEPSGVAGARVVDAEGGDARGREERHGPGRSARCRHVGRRQAVDKDGERAGRQAAVVAEGREGETGAQDGEQQLIRGGRLAKGAARGGGAELRHGVVDHHCHLATQGRVLHCKRLVPAVAVARAERVRVRRANEGPPTAL